MKISEGSFYGNSFNADLMHLRSDLMLTGNETELTDKFLILFISGST